MGRAIAYPACWAAGVLLALSLGASAGPAAGKSSDARAVHESLLTLDSHLDTPAHFSAPGWDILDRHTVEEDGSQVDYPRMVDGGLDGGFFAVFTPVKPLTPEGDAASRDAALIRAVEIREMVARHADRFTLALKADDAPAIAARGRRVVFLSMENGQPVEADLGLMRTFYALGVRLMGPVHFKANDLADSATDAPRWGGLSDKGRAAVAEANRLGIVLDASHASDAAFDQMLALSRTPIVLSHSGCRAVFDHRRNIDDARLKALAAKGGVIQVLAFNGYMAPVPKDPARDAAYAALQKDYLAAQPLGPEARKAFAARRRALAAQFPVPKADFETFMAHLDHALKVAGVDHVGIGLDLDGGGGVAGLEDVADAWKITARLLQEGYAPADIQKIWSGNILRVLRAAEAARPASAPGGGA